MQNSDTTDPQKVEEEIASCSADPASLITVAVKVGSHETSAATTRVTDSGRPEGGVQSDPESRPKAKTRSRFSSAIRKLSKSSRKKKDVPLENPEFVVSSGGEDPAEPEEKPKKKRRFLLGGFRKSKIKKSDQEETEINLDHLEEAKQTVEGVKSDAKEGRSDVPDKKGPITKVQIKISGKKIEPLPGSQVTESGWCKSQDEASDYVLPRNVEEEQEEAEQCEAQEQRRTFGDTASTNDISSPSPDPSQPVNVPEDKNKKQQPKIPLSKLATTTTTPADTPTQSKSKVVATTTKRIVKSTSTTEEKFVITQSTRDTPPPEKAPAKPSRLTTTAPATVPSSSPPTSTTQTSSGSGAVRKTKSRAATLAAPSIIQRFKSGGAKKQRATTAESGASKAAPDLMQNSPTSTQRGHRFPKPTITNATTISRNPTPIATATVVAKPNEYNTEEQIQLQLQSHESGSNSQQKQLHQETQPQSATSKQPLSLQSREAQHPPPLVADIPSAITSEIRSPLHSSPSLAISDTGNTGKELSATERSKDESVVFESLRNTDEVLASSAESANPSEYLASNLRITNQSGRQLASTTLAPPGVHFAVGSPVRPQPISFESLQEQNSSDSTKTDSDSQSPFVELSRRRILHYVEEPSFYDDEEDEDSLDRSLAALVYTGNKDLTRKDSESKQMPAFGDLTMDQEMEPAIMTTSNAEKREHLYKILVIGELGTGKTSFIKRYVHQFFSQNYRATIGVDFALKVLHWDSNTIVRLQLWDIAGQERFGNMTRVYYKEAVGAFIVFDVTRSGTFDCVSKWKEDLDSKVQLPDGSPIPCILLANKCDQEKQGIVTSPEKMDEYVKENGFAGWFETSAKENINIDEAARALVNKILLNDKLISDSDLSDGEKFNLNNSGDQTVTESKSKCSC